MLFRFRSPFAFGYRQFVHINFHYTLNDGNHVKHTKLVNSLLVPLEATVSVILFAIYRVGVGCVSALCRCALCISWAFRVTYLNKLSSSIIHHSQFGEFPIVLCVVVVNRDILQHILHLKPTRAHSRGIPVYSLMSAHPALSRKHTVEICRFVKLSLTVDSWWMSGTGNCEFLFESAEKDRCNVMHEHAACEWDVLWDCYCI